MKFKIIFQYYLIAVLMVSCTDSFKEDLDSHLVIENQGMKEDANYRIHPTLRTEDCSIGTYKVSYINYVQDDDCIYQPNPLLEIENLTPSSESACAGMFRLKVELVDCSNFQFEDITIDGVKKNLSLQNNYDIVYFDLPAFNFASSSYSVQTTTNTPVYFACSPSMSLTFSIVAIPDGAQHNYDSTPYTHYLNTYCSYPCAPNEMWNGQECVVDPTWCPDGFEWNGSTCLPIPSENFIYIISDQLSIPTWQIDSNDYLIADYNLDSLDIIDLIMVLENEFDVVVEEELLNEIIENDITVGLLYSLILLL